MRVISMSAVADGPEIVVMSDGSAPRISISASGNQFQITWTGGVLQEATALTGPWSDVNGNPTSPYLVTPTGAGKFYRTRQ